MTISISTLDAASAVRAFPWPVLEAGNRAFLEGAYAVDVEHRERGRSFMLSHRIDGAPLLGRWLEEGKVLFACACAAPVSAYRELHSSSDPSHLVSWDPDDLGSHPVFTPMIVAGAKIRHAVDADGDGLNALWDGRTIQLPKGARLAVGPTFALQSGLLGLLDFIKDEKMGSGRFRVEASREGGFRFNVYLAVDLFRFLALQRQEPVRWNIMTHIVSAVFARLQRDFDEDNDEDEEGWKSYANLLALADDLERRNMPHWGDEAFEPELVATEFYPHKTDSGD